MHHNHPLPPFFSKKVRSIILGHIWTATKYTAALSFCAAAHLHKKYKHYRAQQKTTLNLVTETSPTHQKIPLHKKLTTIAALTIIALSITDCNTTGGLKIYFYPTLKNDPTFIKMMHECGPKCEKHLRENPEIYEILNDLAQNKPVIPLKPALN